MRLEFFFSLPKRVLLVVVLIRSRSWEFAIKKHSQRARIFLAVVLFTAATKIGYLEYGLGSQSLSGDATESFMSD